MSIVDTHQYGSLYVDGKGTVALLEEREAFTGDSREALRAFEESGAEFSFDPDWTGLGREYGMYSDPEQLPLVLIGHFGGYPGESWERANADAAKEWAEDRDDVMAFSSWIGGCEQVSLWYDLSSITAGRESAQEAVDLAERFRVYSVLDEELWSQYQWTAWEEMISEMISNSEEATAEMRPDTFREFTDAQREQIRDLASEYFGHWEEGHFPEEEWDEIVNKVLNGEVQLHQDTELEILFTGGN